MGIEYKNSEGYPDPTYHDAMTNVMKEYKAAHPTFRPLVYICSPFSGDVEGNTEKTAKFCRFALEKGMIPLAPHLMFPQFMKDDDPVERDLAIFMDIVLMGKCQEVWVLGDRITRGMRWEIEKAEQRHQRIRRFSASFEEVDQL